MIMSRSETKRAVLVIAFGLFMFACDHHDTVQKAPGGRVASASTAAKASNTPELHVAYVPPEPASALQGRPFNNSGAEPMAMSEHPPAALRPNGHGHTSADDFADVKPSGHPAVDKVHRTGLVLLYAGDIDGGIRDLEVARTLALREHVDIAVLKNITESLVAARVLRSSKKLSTGTREDVGIAHADAERVLTLDPSNRPAQRLLVWSSERFRAAPASHF